METRDAVERARKATQVAKMRVELAQARLRVANQQLQDAIELWSIAADEQLKVEKAAEQSR